MNYIAISALRLLRQFQNGSEFMRGYVIGQAREMSRNPSLDAWERQYIDTVCTRMLCGEAV
jgi:hypothetical protein